MIDIEKLLELESNSYESDFVPAVIKHIRPLLFELKAARNIVENLRLFFCSNHEEIIDQTCAVCLNSPNGETCAEALLNKIQEYDEVTNANT